MDHVMVDIETLGRGAEAAFISIGACEFDPETEQIGNSFEVNIDWDSAMQGRFVDGGTLKWWMRQGPEAKAQALAPGKSRKDALIEFGRWYVNGQDVSEKRIWGNGENFDVVILEHAFKQAFGRAPWPFWAGRDVRTIVDLARGIVDKDSFTFTGKPHRPLDDAVHQAKYVSAMWKALRGSAYKKEEF